METDPFPKKVLKLTPSKKQGFAALCVLAVILDSRCTSMTSVTHDKTASLKVDTDQAWQMYFKKKRSCPALQLMAKNLARAREARNGGDKCKFLGAYAIMLNVEKNPAMEPIARECLQCYDASPPDDRVSDAFMARVIAPLAAREAKESEPSAAIHWARVFSFASSAQDIPAAEKRGIFLSYSAFLRRCGQTEEAQKVIHAANKLYTY